ncbi:MAG: DUF2207 domain-containing protein [Burkholderiales bacterium]|nr:DUF2207 domain-containing protein [Burkholderiales bacterium]
MRWLRRWPTRAPEAGLHALVSALAPLVFAAAALAAPMAIAAEAIEHFESHIEVDRDGTLTVTETIRVRAEGREIKRGIYRDFPLTFRDAEGRRRQVSFELLDVTRNGQPEPHFTRSHGDGLRIYAGEEKVFLRPGVHTYGIRYRTGRQIRFLAGHDELFWNVTGNEWAFPILFAKTDIHLPDDAAPVRWTAYTGAFGERGDAWQGEVTGDGVLQVATTRPLAPRQGLSVVVEIPGGLVVQPAGLVRMRYAFLDYKGFILGGLGALAVLAYYLIAWSAVGRDPPKGTIIPLFHPPDGISPALAGYVRDWGWEGGWRGFTAAVVSLAVKGLLVVDDAGGELTLSRRGPRTDSGGAKLPSGEQAILGWVDTHGGTVGIDKSSGASLAAIFARFKSSIEKENRHRFFRRNLGYFLFGAAMTAATVFAVLKFGNLSDAEIAVLVIGALVCGVIGAMVMPLLRVLMGRRSLRTIIAAGVNLTVIVVIATIVYMFFADSRMQPPEGFARHAFEEILGNGFPMALIGGLAVLNGLFYYLLRAPTAAGRVVMDRIEGLELYLRTAETERMNIKDAPDVTTETFERLLPYAIALGAEKPWSEAFARAFARAHPGEDVMDGYRPVWHGGRGWSGSSFGSSMAGAVSASQSAFTSSLPAPQSSSSGFSGGGGSGGGGGGGGGGGW